jgi:hypothetical protein
MKKNIFSKAFPASLAPAGLQGCLPLGVLLTVILLPEVAYAAVDARVATAVSRYLATQGAVPGNEALPAQPDAFDLESLSIPLPPPSDSAVQVTGSRWDRVRQLIEFHLKCEVASACRPFLATMRTRNGNAPSAMPSGKRNSTEKEREQRVRSVARGKPLVHAGEHVRLVVSGPGIRMKIPVVCLEPGVRGQTIRVRGVEDSKLFHAEVLGAGILATAF